MKALKYIGLFLLSFLAIASLLVTSFVLRPQWYIHQGTLKWANDKFMPEYEVEWDNIDFDIRPYELGTYRIELKGHDFCVRDSIGSEYCFTQLGIQIGLFFFDSPIYEFEKLVAESKHILHISEPNTDSGTINISSTAKLIHDSLKSIKKLKPNDFSIDLQSVVLKSTSGNEQRAQIMASNNSLRANYTNASIKIDTNLELNSSRAWTGTLSLKNDSVELKSDIHFRSDDSINLKSDNSLKIIALKKSLLLKTIKFDLNYSSTNKKAKLKIGPATIRSLKTKSTLSVDTCQIEIPFSDSDVSPYFCTASIEAILPTKNRSKSYKLISRLDGELQNSLEFEKNKSPITKFDFSLKDKNVSTIDIDGRLSGSINWLNSALNYNFNNIDFIFKVKKFIDVINLADEFNIAIPTPINSLQGQLIIQAKDFQFVSNSEFKIPFNAQFDLDKAKFNKLNASVGGSFKYFQGRPMQLEANIDINTFHIYLPKLDPIRGIPNFKEDSRITKQIAQQKSQNTQSIDYSINVNTRTNKSIRVYYYLIDPFLEFGFSSKIDNKVKFNIENGPSKMDLNYLKRSLRISHFKINQSNPTTPIDLDLQLIYKISGYTVFVNIEGNAENPVLVLESEPALPRDDIISLVLYGQTSSGLARFEKESVGSTQAAISDKALGLFSIWAFASTPIESVSYEPGRKVYSANVALPGNVTLNIGTDWDQVNQLSLRKYISRGWSVVTSYQPSELEEEKTDFLLKKEISY